MPNIHFPQAGVFLHVPVMTEDEGMDGRPKLEAALADAQRVIMSRRAGYPTVASIVTTILTEWLMDEDEAWSVDGISSEPAPYLDEIEDRITLTF